MNILSQIVHGRIVNYRTGPKAQYSRQCLIEFESITSGSLAGKLVGQKVTWKNGDTKFVGKITGPTEKTVWFWQDLYTAFQVKQWAQKLNYQVNFFCF